MLNDLDNLYMPTSSLAICFYVLDILWYTNNSFSTCYTTINPHTDSRSDISAYVTSHDTAYKIIACIERATVLRANITRVTRAGEGLLSLFTIDKLMSGFSFEGKAFKKPTKL